jgi:hypothetical protein
VIDTPFAGVIKINLSQKLNHLKKHLKNQVEE